MILAKFLKNLCEIENILDLRGCAWCVCSGRSKGARGTRIPPGVQILSISCSFWEHLANSYVGAPWGVGAPNRGNPGSATGMGIKGQQHEGLPTIRDLD